MEQAPQRWNSAATDGQCKHWPSKNRIKLVVEAILNIPSSALCMVPVVLRDKGNLTESCASRRTRSKTPFTHSETPFNQSPFVQPEEIPDPHPAGMCHTLWDVTFGEEGELQAPEPWQEPAPLARFCSQTPQDKATASRTFLKHKSVGPHFPHPPRMTKISTPGSFQLPQAEASLCFY